MSDEIIKALAPFVTHYQSWMDSLPDHAELTVFPRHNMGDLRRVRSVLASLQESGAQPWPLHDMLRQLRAWGNMVAVHNDYRQNGERFTFWLFVTPDGRAIKGEGKTDEEALNQVRVAIVGEPFASLQEGGDGGGDWKLVPVKLTSEMVSAFYVTVGEMSESDTRNIDLLQDGAERIWTNLLSASPARPGGVGDGRKVDPRRVHAALTAFHDWENPGDTAADLEYDRMEEAIAAADTPAPSPSA